MKPPPYIRPDAPYVEPEHAYRRERAALRWLGWAMFVAVMVLSILIGSTLADVQSPGEPFHYRRDGVPITVGPPLTSAPPDVQP